MAYCSDGISIVIGAVMGTSPVTVFVGELPLFPVDAFWQGPSKALLQRILGMPPQH